MNLVAANLGHKAKTGLRTLRNLLKKNKHEKRWHCFLLADNSIRDDKKQRYHKVSAWIFGHDLWQCQARHPFPIVSFCFDSSLTPSTQTCAKVPRFETNTDDELENDVAGLLWCRFQNAIWVYAGDCGCNFRSQGKLDLLEALLGLWWNVLMMTKLKRFNQLQKSLRSIVTWQVRNVLWLISHHKQLSLFRDG